MDPRKVSELRAFVKMCKQDPSVLHTEEMRFLREWVESMGGKVPPATQKAKSEEHIKEEKTDSKKAEENIKTEEPSSEESDLEIDNEGVIEPDTDAPQEMGDENVEYKMTTKRKNMTSPGGSAKIRRKAIDLEMKMKIINQYEAGKKVKEIARDLELAHSTVSTILKDKDRVKEAVKSSVGFKAIITRQRKGLIHEMEKLLVMWFDDQIKKKMPMSLLIIQAKARSIFETLKAREGEESTETFTASHGWFQRFRRRFNLHNWSIRGEAGSVDVEAAEKFVDQFDKIIEEGSCRPEQIFNLDETRLFWKKVPESSYVHEETKMGPGFKAFQDRVTLSLVGNTEGELANKDLIEAEQHSEDEEKKEQMEEVEKKFTVKGLASVFSKVNAALLELEGMDPNVERFTKVEQKMNELLRCYHEIYEEQKKLRKQTTITSFFSKATSRTPTPKSALMSSLSSSLHRPSTAPDGN